MSARWQEQARCAGLDPALFFPEQGALTTEAKAVCKLCPVKTECLEDALVSGERFGVRGGMSERQRVMLRQTRASARRCRFCGDRFAPSDPRERYCSEGCQVMMHAERQRVSRAS